ncbi:MAG: hypothetical protein QXP01_09680 [Candidatus Hadarchaeum sp.]
MMMQMCGPHKTNRKLFAFWGSDVKDQGGQVLQEVFDKGYTLLALDVPAIGAAAEARIPYTTTDDWIDPETMYRVKQDAVLCESSWFRSARDKFTANGVCWPEFDHHAMHWFWLDAMLALELAQVFRARELEELGFSRAYLARPALYYYLSDIVTGLWMAELGHSASLYPLSDMAPRTSFRQNLSGFLCLLKTSIKGISGKIATIFPSTATSGDRLDATLPLPRMLQGRVVFALNPGELFRFGPIIKKLSDDMPGQVAVITLWDDPEIVANFVAEWSVPLVSAPPPAPLDPDLGLQFLDGYAQTKEMASGNPWQRPLKHLDFHFEHYCVQRWPILEARLRSWSSLWQQAQPQAVIVSQLQDSEAQLPAEAARRLGIPTFAIPHAAVFSRTYYAVPSEHVLYSFLTQKATYQRSGVSESRLIPCSDIAIMDEYPVVSVEAPEGVWRVLALTDPIGYVDCLTPTISPRAQLQALATLNNPPGDIAQHLSLRIKVHPNPTYSDLPIFSAVSDSLRKRILPTNSKLSTVLEETDLIVAVNYCGSALVHAFRDSKPVIFFWTDPLIGKTEPLLHAELFLSGGVIARSADELWHWVRRYFTTPAVAEEIRSRAKRFFHTNLDDTKFPRLDYILISAKKGDSK